MPEPLLRKVLPLFHDGIQTLSELPEALRPYYQEGIQWEGDGEKVARLPSFPQVARTVYEHLREIPSSPTEREAAFHQIEKRLKEAGITGRPLYHPLRLIFSGVPHGPDLLSLFTTIPTSILQRRIEEAYQWVEKAKTP